MPRLTDLSIADQRQLLAHLQGVPALIRRGSWVQVTIDLLRDNLAREDAKLPRRLTEFDDEPPRGSVIMTQGLGGTAWQRRFSDGLWASITGEDAEWDYLVEQAAQIPSSGVWLVLEGQPR